MKQIKVKDPRLQRVLDGIKPWHIALAWVIALAMLWLAWRVR